MLKKLLRSKQNKIMETNILRTILLLSVLIFIGCEKAENTEPLEEQKTNVQGAVSENSNENSSSQEPANKAENTEDDKAAESASVNKGDKIESIYTDLSESKCKTTNLNEEEQWSVQECPGIEGYKLEITEGDLRQTINVLAPSGGKYELDFQRNVSLGFSAFGEKAEWRVKKVDGKTQPIALITRFNVNDNPEKPEKPTSYLVVTKFDGEFVCITDVVKPIKNANEKARELADVAPTKPCLKGNAN